MSANQRIIEAEENYFKVVERLISEGFSENDSERRGCLRCAAVVCRRGSAFVLCQAS
jgi:hypothetical protein